MKRRHPWHEAGNQGPLTPAQEAELHAMKHPKVRPLHDDVVLLPETVEAARGRVSSVLALVGDMESYTVRAGYPDPTHRAEVLAVGPEVREVKPGDVVLVPSARNADEHTITVGEVDYLVYKESTIIAVVVEP